ncbi:hypothetical protein RFI_18699, partial [Reticulomyxa filosa]
GPQNSLLDNPVLTDATLSGNELTAGMTSPVDMEIERWKTEAAKWKGLLDNSQAQHNQEIEKLRKECLEMTKEQLTVELQNKLTPMQKELLQLESRLNAALSQIQTLKEDKIKTIQHLNVALETSRYFIQLIFYNFYSTYIICFSCLAFHLQYSKFTTIECIFFF